MGFFTETEDQKKVRVAAETAAAKARAAAAVRAPIEEQKKRDAAVAAAKKKRDARLAEQEKASRGKPVTKYQGGNAGPKPIVLSHHESELPVAYLPPQKAGTPPVVPAARALLQANPRRQHDAVWMAKGKTADKLYKKVSQDYGLFLSKLRQGTWWRELTETAGVAYTPPAEDEPWSGQYTSGTRKVTTVTVPTILGVRVAKDGLRIRIKHRVGDSAKAWTSKLDMLKSAFKSAGLNASGLTISEDRQGNVILKLNDKDPLSEPLPAVIHPYDEQRGVSYLGRAADGSDIQLTWKNNASSLIAGMQGSGKTASLMPMVAGLAGFVELHIVDCGASGEWEVFEPICASYDDTGDLIAVAKVMEYAMKASRERMKKIRSYGAINFWELSVEQRHAAGLHHMVIILEEAPMALGQGQSDKEDKKIAEVNMSLTGRTVKTVRKAGITVVLVAQKPAATEIPTIIRDNAGQRVCFRLDSDVAAQTVLGDSAHVEPKPTSIPAGRPGRFVARVDARGNVYGQSVYMPIEDIATYLAGQQRIPPMDESVPAPAPSPDNDDAPATPTPAAQATHGPGVDVAQGNGQPAFNDDDLLAALAEAQRRGLIPRPDAPAPAEPVTKPEQPQPQPQPQPTGFDF